MDNRGLLDKHLPTISSLAAQFKQNNSSADAAPIVPVQQGLAGADDRCVRMDCPLRQRSHLRRHCVVDPLLAPAGNP